MGQTKAERSGEGAAHDQRVDLVGALVGVDGLGVGEEAGRIVREEDPVAAEHLSSERHGLAGAQGCRHLRERRALVAPVAGVLAGREPGDEPERGREVSEHARELLLHELEAADRAAELLPFAGVPDGGVQGAGLHPGRDPRDIRAHRAEQPCDIPPRVDPLQPCRLGHAHAVESDVEVLHGPQGDLALDEGEGEPGRLAGHEEGLDLAVGGVAGEHGDELRRAGAADPALRALEHPCVALAACRRGEAPGDVRAVVGLGEGEHAGRAERADAGVQGFRLLRRPAESDGRAEEPGLRVVEGRHGGVGAREHVVAPSGERAGVGLLGRHALRLHEIERREGREHRVRHRRGLPGGGQRRPDLGVEGALQTFERGERSLAQPRRGEAVGVEADGGVVREHRAVLSRGRADARRCP
ncbi:hypothetical protein QE381_001754 [Microbacterium sp. SORGH_AS 888]|nr:hypothetical protein [Microbacterium sp. SORGH_AS_0888]